VHRAPGIPHALISPGEKLMHHSGAERRENVEVRASLFEIEPNARRPGQASADPGFMTTDVRGCAKAVEQRVSKQAIGVWIWRAS
jgi:hypothetical protein